MIEKKHVDLIRAAGGLVWRANKKHREILVIHRTRYDDWILPKGKLRDDERWEEAAMREVTEETGYSVEIVSFANNLFYYVSKRPKMILFWNMKIKGKISKFKRLTDSPDEGDQVKWLTLEKALERITYEDEKQLLINEYKRQPFLSTRK
jgi:8-oxo-dGTP diphosphatase